MRSALMLSLGLVLVAAAATRAGDEKAPQPSKGSYIKVRVEVEVRGILRHTDKGTTVTALGRVYELFNDARELPQGTHATAYALDFARANDLRQLAKVLSGKEVVVTGMSELRLVTQRMGQPGGSGYSGPNPPAFPSPTWSLQRTVLVTGLKSAADE